MRLLELKGDSTSEFSCSLTRDLLNNVPRYAILSHTWRTNTEEEVSINDLRDGAGKNKPGYEKIQFCGKQAKRDKIQHFWIDTCCIDKSSNAELQEAINSMFRWYRNAAKCYVYLADVSMGSSDNSDQMQWESSFWKSRWFTRGWTIQELVAPASVEFFSKEGKLLGDKRSLERHIHEVTGIPIKALQGSPLSNFSILERILWAEKRETAREEDMVYSLLGIFDIYMPLIYGEGKEKAFKRLRQEIDKTLKGTYTLMGEDMPGIRQLITRIGMNHEDFLVAFSLSDVFEIEHFVAREEELAEIHRTLHGDGSRRTVVLHGLGGIGKTQLTVAYAKRHRDNYSAIFWLNSKDQDSLKGSFVKVAKRILREHPSVSRLSSVDIKGNLDEVIDAVKVWLDLPNNTRWLMIYDNYNNPKLPGNKDPSAVDIGEFLPESSQGSVIIITRSSQVGKIGHPVEIRKLEDVHDSLEILSNASGRKGLINNPDAVRLAQELDGLPLALARAGAYLDQTAIGFSEYLNLYKASSAELLKDSPDVWSYED
ncbi:HET domain containing protein [Elaphomyces granulatus]